MVETEVGFEIDDLRLLAWWKCIADLRLRRWSIVLGLKIMYGAVAFEIQQPRRSEIILAEGCTRGKMTTTPRNPGGV